MSQEYYRQLEVRGKKYGEALRLAEDLNGVTLLVENCGIMKFTYDEMISVVKDCWSGDYYDGGWWVNEYRYVKRLVDGGFISMKDPMALLNEWRAIKHFTNVMTVEEAEDRLRKYVSKMGYGVKFVLSTLDGVANGVEIFRVFQPSDELNKLLLKSDMLGVKRSQLVVRFQKEIRKSLRSYGVLEFKGDIKKQYVVDGGVFFQAEDGYVIRGDNHVSHLLVVHRPLILTEAGVRAFIQYFGNNFKYVRK